jgi:hypothetical protein
MLEAINTGPSTPGHTGGKRRGVEVRGREEMMGGQKRARLKGGLSSYLHIYARSIFQSPLIDCAKWGMFERRFQIETQIRWSTNSLWQYKQVADVQSMHGVLCVQSLECREGI